MIEIPYALKEGVLTHVSEVEKGLDCGCVCVCCNNPVVAKQGKIKQWHFAHKSDCSCNQAGETLLHIMAKEVIKDAGYIKLPEVSLCFYRGGSGSGFNIVFYEEKTIFFDDIVLEQKVEAIKPDIIIHKGGRPLAVEVAYSHFCDKTKKKKIKDIELSTIEIDLRNLGEKDVFNRDKIKQFLVDSVRNTKWIYNKKLEEVKKKIGALGNEMPEFFWGKRNVVECPKKQHWIKIHKTWTEVHINRCRGCTFLLCCLDTSQAFCTYRPDLQEYRLDKNGIKCLLLNRQRLNPRLFDNIVK